VGNREVLADLALIKSNIDYGVFYAVQEAGIAALTGPQDYVVETARTYQRRRDVLVDGLAELGWRMPKPNASMFVWAPLPPGYDSSADFAAELLERAGVIVIPGWLSAAGEKAMSGSPWSGTKRFCVKWWKESGETLTLVSW